MTEHPPFLHVHVGPPYKCFGGGRDPDDVDILLEVIREDIGHEDAFVIESKDAPLACDYRPNPCYYVVGR